MKNCFVKNKDFSIVCGGKVVNLTIVPLTFMKLIDINSALPQGKDLGSVMQDPAPLDLSIVLYCLLDSESKKRIENIKIDLGGEEVEATSAHKLFYMMCENNVTDGMNNYSTALEAVVEMAKESTSQPETKKKILLNPMRWILKKLSI